MDVLLWITLLSGAAWLYLALAHGRFWLTGQRLAPRGTVRPPLDPARAPSVAVVVPARDEADVIGSALPTLLAQDYAGPARVILVDDGSTDGTGDLAKTFGTAPEARLPLTVTTPGPPPPGWTGKLWALRHGVEVATGGTAQGDEAPAAGAPDFLLFTDADIAHAPDSLTRLVDEAVYGPVSRRTHDRGRVGGPASADPHAAGRLTSSDPHAADRLAPADPHAADPLAEPDRSAPSAVVPGGLTGRHASASRDAADRDAVAPALDFVSVMARLRVETGWERVIVPAFVYFFAKLFPFARVNNPRARTAAAAGGCVLVGREALARAGGIEAIRDAVIDDVTLGTAVKRSGGRIRLVLADSPTMSGAHEAPGAGPFHVDSVRPYPRLADLWRMVSRSAFAQLRHSWLLLAGTVFGLALVYLAAPVALVTGAVAGDWLLVAAGGATWLLMTVTYVPMIRYYGRPFYEALLLPFAASLYLGMTVDSAIQHARGRGAAWKGRTYPAPARDDADARPNPR
ncbi:glycosyltransferase [Yinghuangia seranimata]|uniref:glycosyltransferase n=1 Tax=Yinghuangia seranimata TaxID=408067 RepID=UPI00248C208C|nr:glycosyltransferase [Yinghuangia seranimata]MDI2131956.1 glycosyltransferase [Yinghuangia seranimata]